MYIIQQNGRKKALFRNLMTLSVIPPVIHIFHYINIYSMYNNNEMIIDERRNMFAVQILMRLLKSAFLNAGSKKKQIFFCIQLGEKNI